MQPFYSITVHSHVISSAKPRMSHVLPNIVILSQSTSLVDGPTAHVNRSECARLVAVRVRSAVHIGCTCQRLMFHTLSHFLLRFLSASLYRNTYYSFSSAVQMLNVRRIRDYCSLVSLSPLTVEILQTPSETRTCLLNISHMMKECFA